MRLNITDKTGTAGEAIKPLVSRQVGFSLSRFDSVIRDIRVRIRDLNGPRGGIDKQCQVVVRFRTGGSVIAEVEDVAIEPAVHRALDRVARRVQRFLDLKSSRRFAAMVKASPTPWDTD